ncbi:hypothetical protein BKA69DRAFT_726913 [Paraphysoderma sedebokerense]|nr:hypothetical protein BKA69DRAFT_726913 [Paraphysoderma sedebokerense]
MIRVRSRELYTVILLGCMIFSIYSISATLPYFDAHSRFSGVGAPRERLGSKERGKALLKAGVEIFEILYPSTTLSREIRVRTQNEVDVKTKKRRDDDIADSTITGYATLLNAIMSKSYISRPTSLSPRPVPYTTKSRFAYVTLLTSTSFLPGTLALSESIYQQATIADIIVLVLSHVPHSVRTTLCGYGLKVMEVEYIRNPNKNMVTSRQKYKFAKLRAWELDEYESIIVLGL